MLSAFITAVNHSETEIKLQHEARYAHMGLLQCPMKTTPPSLDFLLTWRCESVRPAHHDIKSPPQYDAATNVLQSQEDVWKFGFKEDDCS